MSHDRWRDELHQARTDTGRLVALLGRGAPSDGLQLAGTAILAEGPTAAFNDVIAGLASRRSALAELLGMVLKRDEGAWQESPIERWVIESAQPLPDLTAVEWPWPDLDSSGLAWEYNPSGVRCAIVTMPHWEYTYEEASNYSGALGSGIFRRPLLPGESACDDVFAWRAVLGFDDGMLVAPPDLA